MGDVVCAKCRQVHHRCVGHRKTDGGPCQRRAKEGATVCIMHGGGAPQVIRKAEERRLEAVAETAYRRLIDNPDAPPVIDALDALSRLAGRLEHAVSSVGDRLAELTSIGVQTAAGGEQLRAEVILWDKLLGHFRGALKDLVAAGFVERQTQLAEHQGLLIARAIQAILDDLELSAEQRQLVTEVVPRHLRALADAG